MSQNQSNHSRNSSKNNITSSENNYNKKYATDTTQNSDKKMQHKISIKPAHTYMVPVHLKRHALRVIET